MDYNKINYNEYAKSYSQMRNASSRVIEHIVDRIEDKHISSVLEIGCGTADYLYVLKENLGFDAYGFDKSTEMLKEGMLKNPGLNLVAGDANQNFPYEEATFDFIFSISVIHYINNLEHYFKEAYRVMKPGGIILTVIADIDKMKETVNKYFPEFDENIKKFGDLVEQISESMKNVGLDVTRKTRTDFKYNMRKQDLEPIKKKVFAWVRLLSDDCFNKGVELMEEDINKDSCIGSENFTYIWGVKR